MIVSGNRLRLYSLVLAVTVATTGCSNEPNQNVLPADSKVVALGDLLTYGYRASPENTYPTILAIEVLLKDYMAIYRKKVWRGSTLYK